MQRIDCIIDTHSSFRAAAWYGLRMAFLPFRVEPVMLESESIDTTKGHSVPSIYYGSDPDAHPDATLRIIQSESTIDFFDARVAPFPSSRFVRIGQTRVPVMFEASGDVTFDPVATVFYFLSGWQETVIRARDEHGRFPWASSVQHNLDVRLMPVVDWTRHILADLLRKKEVRMERKEFGQASWAFCATHDIDYIRKWRPGIYKRELLDRAILNQQKESVKDRLGRVFRTSLSLIESGDPFRDALVRIMDELEKREARGTFFYKAAAYGQRDVSYHLMDGAVQQAILRQLDKGHEIGLHPSYHSFAHPERLLSERDRLRSASQHSVSTYRAHYLRHDHPASIHLLESAGFDVDSTIGFAECTGFRFGTCLPFPLFDPVSMKETRVWEMPLVMMESALFNRQHLDRAQAEKETLQLMQTCASFGGVFTGLWHNTLWDESDYPGWGAHFLTTLDEAVRLGASRQSLSDTLASWQ